MRGGVSSFSASQSREPRRREEERPSTMRRNVCKPACCLAAMTDGEGCGVFLAPLFAASECPPHGSTTVHIARSPPAPPPLTQLTPGRVRVAAHSTPTVCGAAVSAAAASSRGSTLRWEGPPACFLLILLSSSQTSGTHLELFNERPRLPQPIPPAL